MSDFKPGDRVFITSHDHPWARHAGEITGPFSAASAPDLKWTVSIDGAWGEAAVAESDIRKVPPLPQPG
jgi:hypothetical protein